MAGQIVAADEGRNTDNEISVTEISLSARIRFSKIQFWAEIRFCKIQLTFNCVEAFDTITTKGMVAPQNLTVRGYFCDNGGIHDIKAFNIYSI